MKLTWFGHSCFRLDLDGAAILFDPFFTDNPSFEAGRDAGAVAAARDMAVAGATHILITHGHGDHVGDAIAISRLTGAKVVTNYDLAVWLIGQGLDTLNLFETTGNTGGTIDLGRFAVTFTRADHSAAMGEPPAPAGSANGLIVRADGRSVWHMGDTDIFSDMALIAEIHSVDTCICPIGDRFTMSPRTAAIAMTRYVKPKIAVPCHYGTFPILAPTADGFLSAMQTSNVRVVLPPIGEAVDL